MNPTLEDNFPPTNLEFIDCKTPVITFDAGGSPECINKDIGKIYNTKTVTSLTKNIDDIICKNISEKSNDRYKFIRNYNKYIKFKEYISIYEKIFIVMKLDAVTRSIIYNECKNRNKKYN